MRRAKLGYGENLILAWLVFLFARKWGESHDNDYIIAVKLVSPENGYIIAVKLVSPENGENLILAWLVLLFWGQFDLLLNFGSMSQVS
jgi:hypothetical protein